jgi:V8-like Glu-specific endopeptidase
MVWLSGGAGKRGRNQRRNRMAQFEHLELRQMLTSEMTSGVYPIWDAGNPDAPPPALVYSPESSALTGNPLQPISYDVATGQATALPMPDLAPEATGGAQFTPGSAPAHQLQPPFGDMNGGDNPNLSQTPYGVQPDFVFGADDRRLVGRNNMTVFPWDSIGRVWTLWSDGTQTSATAEVIGRRTLLTAGHVVYDSAHGGYASQVYFSPGEDGNKLYDPFWNTDFKRSDYQYFGESRATQYAALDGWVNNRDWNYDMALVALDRDIGDFTGWMGWGYNSDSFFQGALLNTAGYPGDLTPTVYDMWYTSGTIQTVNADNLQSQIDIYGGQSGSPVYAYIPSNPANQQLIIYATNSSEWSDQNHNPLYNQFTRITSAKYATMQNWVNTYNSTTDFSDVVDYDQWFNTSYASMSSSVLGPGDTFSATAFARNNGTGLASNVSVSFYASTDQTIDGSDYFLGSANVGALTALNSAAATFQGTLPNIPSGTYHLCWSISTSSVEYNGFNNTGSMSSTFAVQPRTGSISGTVYNDADGDGSLDNGETGLSNWIVYLDMDNNGQFNGSDVSTSTDSTGHYSFSSLPLGTYTVREITPSGWKQTQPLVATLSQAADVPFSIPQEARSVQLRPGALPRLNADGTIATSASPVGLTPAQIRKAYGYDQIQFGGTTGDGSGQTVAIVDAYHSPTMLQDLRTFDAAFGLSDPPSFIQVAQDGSQNYPSVDPTGGWAIETALDVEWVHALAPKANIFLVESNDPNSLFDAVDFARNQPNVSLVSMSFGGGEFSQETQIDSLFTTPAGHRGVTFVAATGDDGQPGGYPAYSPNVLAVGGTTLTIDSLGNYVSETGWSLDSRNKGGGGGISQIESQPSYQKGVVTQSSTQRTIPDISLDADPNSGPTLYTSVGGLGWIQEGGTSFSAPAWAALLAIANQGRAAGGKGTMDGTRDTLPMIYGLNSSDLHDITSGFNGFNASVGYDLVTGRGSPKADKVVADFVGASQGGAGAIVITLTAVSPNAVSLNFGNQNSAPRVAVTGNGNSIADGSTSFISQLNGTDFGSVPVGTSAFETYTITNTGSALLTVGNVGLGATTDFVVTSQPASSIASGATSSFTIRYRPSLAGFSSTIVSFSDNDSTQANPFTFAIGGTGTGIASPHISVSGSGQSIADGSSTPSAANGTNFGSTDVGTSIFQTYTIANSGGAALSVGQVSISGSTGFSVVSPPDSTVLAGSSTSFTVQFRPSVAGPQTASVQFADNDTSQFSPFSFMIGGTATSSGPHVVAIVDDPQATYNPPSAWKTAAKGVNNNQHYASSGNGTSTATYVFSGLTPGQYNILATWPANSAHATNVPYKVYDGGTPIAAAAVNQRLAPDGRLFPKFQQLLTVNIVSNTMTVVITNNATGGTIVADAIELVQGGTPSSVPLLGLSAVIQGQGGNGAAIASGEKLYGTAKVGGPPLVVIFTIHNPGSSTLSLTGKPIVKVSGINASDVKITQPAQSSLGPGQTTTFQLSFSPRATGARTAKLTIASNDPRIPQFTVNLSGTGTRTLAATVAGSSTLDRSASQTPVAALSDAGNSQHELPAQRLVGIDASASQINSRSLPVKHPLLPAHAAISTTVRHSALRRAPVQNIIAGKGGATDHQGDELYALLAADVAAQQARTGHV